MGLAVKKLDAKRAFLQPIPPQKFLFERSPGMGFGNLLFFVVGFEVQLAEMRGKQQQWKKTVEAQKPLCL
jgi:hypothetical protein